MYVDINSYSKYEKYIRKKKIFVDGRGIEPRFSDLLARQIGCACTTTLVG